MEANKLERTKHSQTVGDIDAKFAELRLTAILFLQSQLNVDIKIMIKTLQAA